MKRKIISLLALALCSNLLALPTNSWSGSRKGSGAWNRAEQLRANRHTTEHLTTVNRLQGQVVVTPIVVQPNKGPTVVSGNIFINSEPIITKGEGFSAAMLHLLGADEGGTGQILLRGNKFINRGLILSNGGKAGMSVLHDEGLPLSVESYDNVYENLGSIKALK